ncbi:hypothetical protein M3685_11500 [Heyndrickxia oleronia]|uniref:hypothetical protein n=1 Tax=Heyndrickxia oleronia TaxID=38875 RepID=UPI00203D4D37|nr:hypothetical protein [Heyndrickxia oleronia]MCM3454568.1 hypothetical protein [Heyndrickxia oleronia]
MKLFKYSKSLLLLMMILPWFTVPLMGKEAFKRFLPAGLFISLIVRIVNFIAKKRKWWWWYQTLHTKIAGVFPFIWGPFLIGSMWILKLTYGKFFRYMFLNLAIDGAFTYGLVYYLQKLGIASLVRLKKINLLLIFTVEALLLYGFQIIKDRLFSQTLLRFK